MARWYRTCQFGHDKVRRWTRWTSPIKEVCREKPLGTIPAVALCEGVALYLLGHNAFRLRDEGSVSVARLVVTILCLALVPLAVSVPSLITLAVLALLLCGLAAFETAVSREFRREIRAR